ncbi:hypothetical protein L218DRAFT_418922 [Marasmius fiardii PR-910]|nr:hypothetical protein L218DRAFT_418922 [Marasmius fiardii PR-910]
MSMNVHDDGQSNVICKICRRQLSRYTCPSCSIPYCSLICFRSPVHSDCSETFYKKEIQNGIDNQPAKSAKERLTMMEILKRFEDSSLDDEGLFDDDDEGEDDLANRFEGVDLENAAHEDIWDRLTEDEKSRFLKAVENPESDLGKDLLAHSREEFEPWWEIHRNEDEDPESQMPEPMRIPSTMVRATPISTGPPLIYNLCAIWYGDLLDGHAIVSLTILPLQQHCIWICDASF